MRRVVSVGGPGEASIVFEGVTTPWSWASLPGMRTPSGVTYQWWGLWSVWLESTRLPEPLSPEARALVAAARGGK